MRRFLTPDNGDGVYLCRRLRFRAELAGFITGTLERMNHTSEWEAFGTMSPEEAAAYSLEAYNYYLESGDRCVIGDVWIGVTSAYPDGVLPFDGTQYLRVDYPDLYAALDAAFIDDADHFTLHEAAGRALVIAGEGTGLTARAVGERFGSETVSLTAAQNGAHYHTQDQVVPGLINGGLEAPAAALVSTIPGVTGTDGSGDPHDNVQPSLAVKVGVWAL